MGEARGNYLANETINKSISICKQFTAGNRHWAWRAWHSRSRLVIQNFWCTCIRSVTNQTWHAMSTPWDKYSHDVYCHRQTWSFLRASLLSSSSHAKTPDGQVWRDLFSEWLGKCIGFQCHLTHCESGKHCCLSLPQLWRLTAMMRCPIGFFTLSTNTRLIDETSPVNGTITGTELRWQILP